MRGNLIYEEGVAVQFEFDANGEYEVVDGGRITQHQKTKLEERYQEFIKAKNLLQAKQSQPEDNPEYVITAFDRIDINKVYRYNQESDMYETEGDYKIVGGKRITGLQWALKCDGIFKIKSVRRNSDNEEFTVEEITEQGKIAAFILNKGEIVVECTVEPRGFVHYRLSNIIKKKEREVLFISEDNVPVNEGDVYWVEKDSWRSGSALADDIAKNKVYYDTLYFYFSTKEKAEEYIRDNKPLFSVNDIMENAQELYKGEWRGFYELDIAKFMHLAKEKMKS